MQGTNGLLLWVLAGAGTLLVYAAVANANPQSVLLSYMGAKDGVTPISDWNYVAPSGGSTGNGKAGGGGGGGGGSGVGFEDDKNIVDTDGVILANVPSGYKTSPATFTGAVNV